MGRLTVRRRVVRSAADGSRVTRVDSLAVEEPLEVRRGADVLNVTMRTPGDDFDLVAGWLVSEGLVRSCGDLVSASYCPGTDEQGHQTYNVVEVVLADGVGVDRPQRSTWTSSACGVCGPASLDAVRVTSPYDVAGDDARSSMARCSRRFRTGCGRRSASSTGPVACTPRGCSRRTAACSAPARTSVGTTRSTRWWAGRPGRGGCPSAATVLQVSGRASFELVQKAVVAGIPVLSAVSAPSSLAAELAEESGLTLAGFVRAGGFNLYARPERVTGPAEC